MLSKRDVSQLDSRIPGTKFKMTDASPYVIPVETDVDVNDQIANNNNNGEKTEGTVRKKNDVAPGCKMTIEEGLRPLLASMKLFGLYFNCRSEKTDASDSLTKNNSQQKWSVGAVYGGVVVTVLWLNFVRMLLVFTREDRFGGVLLGKLISVIWSFQCATSQTAFYAASSSGRLKVVFRQPLPGVSCARHARKFATVYALIAWLIIVLGSAFYAYTAFFTAGLCDPMIAPFQTHIVTRNLLVPRIVANLLNFHLMAVYIFGQVTTFVLASIFSHQFKNISADLRCRLRDGPRRQVSQLDIETFRQKHQQISTTVSDVDDCLMFSNASAFCCQLSCVIICLYSVIFYISLIPYPIVIVVHVYWMLLFSFGLTLTAAGGIMVNHYVSIGTLLMSISSPIIDRFLKFFHWHTPHTICNNVVIIYSTIQ